MSAISLPNQNLSLQERIAARKITWGTTLGMLFSRILLFAAAQAFFALVFALQGRPDAWQASLACWPLGCIASNLVCLALLDHLLRGEGLRLGSFYIPQRATFWQDLLLSVLMFGISGPIAYLPNVAVGQWLFSDPNEISGLLFHPLALWLAYPVLVLLPLSIALSELPVYGGYVLPRLAALTGKSWLAVLACGLMLAAQHMALPLVFDGRFLLYRLLMFIPFAIYIIAILRWRPRLLPYLVLGHGLMDIMLGTTILGLSY